MIVLPATDLYLMGRRDARNPRRGLAPVKRLLAAGVPVAAATNNVRNAFTPVGNADLALMGVLLAVGAHMGARAELAQVLAMLTTEHPRASSAWRAMASPSATARTSSSGTRLGSTRRWAPSRRGLT